MSILKAKMTIYLIRKNLISLLFIEKIIIMAESINFADIFFKKSIKILPKSIKANKNAIKIAKDKE